MAMSLRVHALISLGRAWEELILEQGLTKMVGSSRKTAMLFLYLADMSLKVPRERKIALPSKGEGWFCGYR